jgi:oxygen-independent coproporphyrinogen-3 oxidase
VPRSIEFARSAGFTRLNLDLIYAIPGQSLESWQQSLEQALAIGTPHLSCYGLTYESNTPIAVKKRLGQMIPTEDSVELQMLHATRARLRQANMRPYEISNYAVPGEECRHNLVYWTGGNYLALGPSGASHIEGHRWKNRPHLGEWEQAIDEGELPAADYEVLTLEQRAGELAMLMLRLEEGLSCDVYTARTGLDALKVYAATADNLVKLGLIEVSDRKISLTERGIDVADAVAGEFVNTEVAAAQSSQPPSHA